MLVTGWEREGVYSEREREGIPGREKDKGKERGREGYKDVGWDGQPRRRGEQGIAMRVDVIARAFGMLPHLAG
jgi:hypothetical protein